MYSLFFVKIKKIEKNHLGPKWSCGQVTFLGPKCTYHRPTMYTPGLGDLFGTSETFLKYSPKIEKMPKNKKLMCQYVVK